MPAPFPHIYTVDLKNINGKNAEVCYEKSDPIQSGPPKEFDGSDLHWSPEGYLFAGVAMCFLTTFRAVHRDEAVKIENLQIKAEGKLEKTSEGLVFTEINLFVSCSTNQNEAAESLFQKAKKHCLISNALKTSPKLNLTLSSI